MGLLSRVKGRMKRALGGAPPPEKPAAPFDAATAEMWKELREQYALGYQTMGAAVVASWEVTAAEIHAAGRRRSAERAPEWVTRFSDALVPTLSPIQAADRACDKVWKQSTRAATASGKLADAMPALSAHARDLGAAVQAGWPGTADWIEPVVVGLGVEEAGRARLAAVGAALRAAIDGRAADLTRALEAVPLADDVESAFLDAIEAWRHGTAQDLEVALDQVRAVLAPREARKEAR